VRLWRSVQVTSAHVVYVAYTTSANTLLLPRDGTTDVTRTLHFGTPTAHEKRCFTRVLQGHIALDVAVFPKGTTGTPASLSPPSSCSEIQCACAGHKLDLLARLPLWTDGLDYRHGTGHGVGAFLNVHEGPQVSLVLPYILVLPYARADCICSVQGIGMRETATRTPLMPGMTVTNGTPPRIRLATMRGPHAP
jgi:Xaa-Pro aminopeptidase